MGECYVLTGKPRTGKTYFMVDYLSKLKGYWRVYHNISGLKPDLFPPEIELIDFTTLEMSLDDILTNDIQSELTQQLLNEGRGRKVLWVFDEAHSCGFGAANSKGDPRVDWVAYHGHFGQRIFIISQDAGMIAKRYRVLSEYEIRSRSTGPFKNPFLFCYQRVSTSGQNMGVFFVRIKKDIFSRYSSEIISGSRNFSLLSVFFILFLVSAVVFYFYVPKLIGRNLGVKEKPAVRISAVTPAAASNVTASTGSFDASQYFLVSYVPGHIPVVSDSKGKIRPLTCFFPQYTVISTNPFTFFASSKIYSLSSIPFHDSDTKGGLS